MNYVEIFYINSKRICGTEGNRVVTGSSISHAQYVEYEFIAKQNMAFWASCGI